MTLESSILDTYKRDLRVPRYTSYPTAPHFSSEITESIYENWLREIPEKAETSLYIHVPFCQKLCWFCGCNTKVTNKYEPIERYLELLTKEMELLSNSIKTPNIKHIHFGGGSPTIINSTDFLQFIDNLRQNFLLSPDAEIAVEIDPRTISEAKIAAYAKVGVNRVSLGIQDFNANVQEAINRVQSFSSVYRVIAMLKNYGIMHMNADLIYGLPHQTVEGLLESIKLTLMLNPQRIALFGYAHVPWIKKHQQLIDESALPDIEARLDMALQAKELLESRGYVAIGLDHFALKTDNLVDALEKKKLQRNFQGYTTDTAETLLGIGISSIGSLPQGYVQNIASPAEYAQCINENRLPIEKGIAMSDEDHLRREIISSLMCYLMVDLKEMAKKRGVPNKCFSRELSALAPFVQQDLITINDAVITVKEQGRIALRIIASVFDSYLEPEKKKHSVAV